MCMYVLRRSRTVLLDQSRIIVVPYVVAVFRSYNFTVIFSTPSSQSRVLQLALCRRCKGDPEEGFVNQCVTSGAFGVFAAAKQHHRQLFRLNTIRRCSAGGNQMPELYLFN